MLASAAALVRRSPRAAWLKFSWSLEVMGSQAGVGLEARFTSWYILPLNLHALDRVVPHVEFRFCGFRSCGRFDPEDRSGKDLSDNIQVAFWPGAHTPDHNRTRPPVQAAPFRFPVGSDYMTVLLDEEGASRGFP